MNNAYKRKLDGALPRKEAEQKIIEKMLACNNAGAANPISKKKPSAWNISRAAAAALITVLILSLVIWSGLSLSGTPQPQDDGLDPLERKLFSRVMPSYMFRDTVFETRTTATALSKSGAYGNMPDTGIKRMSGALNKTDIKYTDVQTVNDADFFAGKIPNGLYGTVMDQIERIDARYKSFMDYLDGVRAAYKQMYEQYGQNEDFYFHLWGDSEQEALATYRLWSDSENEKREFITFRSPVTDVSLSTIILHVDKDSDGVITVTGHATVGNIRDMFIYTDTFYHYNTSKTDRVALNDSMTLEVERNGTDVEAFFATTEYEYDPDKEYEYEYGYDSRTDSHIIVHSENGYTTATSCDVEVVNVNEEYLYDSCKIMTEVYENFNKLFLFSVAHSASYSNEEPPNDEPLSFFKREQLDGFIIFPLYLLSGWTEADITPSQGSLDHLIFKEYPEKGTEYYADILRIDADEYITNGLPAPFSFINSAFSALSYSTVDIQERLYESLNWGWGLQE